MESKAPKASRRVFSAPAGYRPSPSTADAAPIETLYVHPNVRIVSFTAPVASLPPDVDAARLESGTLASSSRLERTIAVGSFRIYRAPGSVAFLSCGSALQPILPKSQCWCVDEDNTRFVLQIRRPNFWRIELLASAEEYKRQAADLRRVFDVILQFEKTYCPFQRGFTVELPDEAFMPVKWKPWKPKHSPVGHDSPASSSQKTCEESGMASGRYGGHRDAARGDAAIARSGESPAAPESHIPFHESDMPLEREAPYTGADYAAIRSSPRPEVPGHSAPLDDIDSPRRRGSDTVAAIIHDFNTRLAGHEAYRTQETSMRSSPSLEELTMGTSNSGVQGETSTRSSVRVEVAAPNKPSDTERPSRSSSQDSFQSICSWHSLSNSGFPPSTGTTARAASQEGCNVHHCQNFDSLRADSAAPVSVANAKRVGAQEPHSSLEASTGSPIPIDDTDTGDVGVSQGMPTGVRSPSPLPLASNIARPSDADHSRPSDPLGRPNGLPMTIMAKTYEALLAPPAHLIVLMLKVAAKLSAGEWGGSVYGYNNTGDQIPVHWDYSEDDLSD